MTPPTGGPTTGPTRAGTVSQASEPTSSLLDTVRRMTSRTTGTIIAQASAWTTRATTMPPIECDSPQRIEPMVKVAIAARKMMRAPTRDASQPDTGMNTASDIRYEVSASLRWIGLTPKSAAIAGNDVE